MNRQPWIVGAAFFAFVACAPWLAIAQEEKAPPASSPSVGAKPGDQAKPKQAAAKKEEEEGPFAPKGKTGKLREEAEEEAPPEEPSVVEVPKNGSAGVDATLGFGKYGTFADPNKVFVASFVVGARYMVTPDMQLGLLIPVTTGNITPSATASSFESTAAFNATAFGNVALAASYIATRGDHYKVSIGATLAAPTASGDPFGSESARRGFAINQAAMRARGFGVDELYESNRFGFVPHADLEYERRWLRARAFTQLPMLIQTGGENPPEPVPGDITWKLNSFAFQWTLGAEGFANVVAGHVDLGLRAWANMRFIETVEQELGEASGKPSKFQFVLEPSVLGRFGNIRSGLSMILPVGGQLGSDVQIYGLRLFGAYTF